MEFKVKLTGKRLEAKETKTFIWEKPAGFTYIAGQFAYFILPQLLIPDARGDTRHFTLSSSPSENFISFTTRMRDTSGFKKTCDKFPIGTEVILRDVHGHFALEDEKETRPQVMIAGGIGVTPYRSIIKYVADKNLTVPIHLINSNSTPEEIPFRGELEEIAASHPNIKVSQIITRPEESKESWTGLTGRINADFLRKMENGKWKMENATFWVCGPPGMVTAVEEILLNNLQIPQERIRIEKFTGY